MLELTGREAGVEDPPKARSDACSKELPKKSLLLVKRTESKNNNSITYFSEIGQEQIQLRAVRTASLPKTPRLHLQAAQRKHHSSRCDC